MIWSVLSEDGRVLGGYRRMATALLNAGDHAVVEGPPETGNARDWRFGQGFTWVHDPLPDPTEVRLAGMDRNGRRRHAYAALDRNLLREVTSEVVLALVDTPEVWALLRQSTKDKIGLLRADIEAVKTANP